MTIALDKEFCEPFRAWNRLEARCRTVDFDRVLQCQIHDPLWMLTRAWQFSEFKGENTGSPIFVKALIQSSRMSLQRMKAGTVDPYDEHVPLETLVESEEARPDFKTWVQAASYAMKLLDHFGMKYNKMNQPVPYKREDFLKSLIDRYPIDTIQTDAADDDALIIEKKKIEAHKKLRQFLDYASADKLRKLQPATSSKSFNGHALFLDLKNAGFSTLFDQLGLAGALRDTAASAFEEFEKWGDRKFGPPFGKQHSAWNESQLEYQFSCAIPNETGDNTVLKADEYYTGRLDWYSVDIERHPPDDIKTSTQAARDASIREEVLSFIPTEVEFSGMPNSRWWEFEDGYVNFGNLNADSTDIAKIIVAEFALIYGNNWFIFPYPLPIGTLSEIKGIVVRDVFGQKTLVEPVSQGDPDDWAGWGMFNLSHRYAGVDDAKEPLPTDTRLFLPPSIAKVQESDPAEEVYMVRDEMANSVWGIETRIPDLMGRGMDGHAAGNDFVNALSEDSPAAQEPETAEGAVLKYTLANTVPENWIPFIPIHTGDVERRKIKLQRASMPRLLRGKFRPVRPRTDILRYGLPQRTVTPDAVNDIQASPYYIHEEEVPKIGIKITSTNQRARWLNGAVFNWYGRRKVIGRGAGSGGLEFDRIEPVKPKK